MKIMSLSETSTKIFSISAIRIFKRKPTYKKLEISHRRANGFFLLEEGESIYTWEGGSIHLQPGSLLYLPWASVHKVEVLSQKYTFYVVNFTLQDENSERIVFSETPMLISKNIGSYFIDYIHRISDQYLENADNFKNIAAVSLFLSELCSYKTVVNKKIAPAVSYISNNLLEPVNGDALAGQCGLSKAQMYRIFKEETGMTPTEYRNRLRVEKACQLLITKEYYIYEVASELGFENLGYFNRIFKKYTGLSPTDYLFR